MWSTGRASVTLSQLTGRQDKPTHLCEDGNTDAIILLVYFRLSSESTQLNYQDSSTDVLSSRLKSYAARTALCTPCLVHFPRVDDVVPSCLVIAASFFFFCLSPPRYVPYRNTSRQRPFFCPWLPRPRKVDDELRRLGTAGMATLSKHCLVASNPSGSRSPSMRTCRGRARSTRQMYLSRAAKLAAAAPELSVGEAGVQYCAAAIEHGEQSEGAKLARPRCCTVRQ